MPVNGVAAMACHGWFQMCSICRKQSASSWVCVVCERVGRGVFACSPRCKRVHARDGRHRKELKAQSG